MQVYVYRNLNKGGYSIMCPKTKKVIGYSTSLVLKNVTFKVRVGGRDRVRSTGHKNVHAFAIGEIVDTVPTTALVKVSYEPRVHEGFIQSVNKLPVTIADTCVMNMTGCYITE